jgi:hypothetical protein
MMISDHLNMDKDALAASAGSGQMSPVWNTRGVTQHENSSHNSSDETQGLWCGDERRGDRPHLDDRNSSGLGSSPQSSINNILLRRNKRHVYEG